jgi:endonuclease/exonuclease/phosphatase family metal-dependent hydrolase
MGRRPKRVYALMIALLVLAMAAVVLLRSGILPSEPSKPPATPEANDTANSTGGPSPPLPEPPKPPENATAPNPSATSNSTIRIATFNIQVFGESKRSKAEVMDVLAKTARNFDILAIQELRDDTETTLPIYLERINSLPGAKYSAVSSPRLGRTSSKENYAFIYNTDTMRLVPGSNFTFTDPPAGSSTDLFQREPFIARFQPLYGDAFDFALITIHTEPDGTPEELSDLPLALDAARTHYGNETDFILLGDMNADCSYLTASEAASLPLRNSSYLWVVPDNADTTVKSTDCAYDRIILAGTAPQHYGGAWGVFRFDEAYAINQSAAEDVSDHFPVWLELATGQ